MMNAGGRLWRTATALAASAFFFALTDGASIAAPHRYAAIERMVPGDRVYLVYDSSEGCTATRNPLSEQVAPLLKEAGFQVLWIDAESGLPSMTELTGARAVVTGFLDSALSGADAYGRWVRAVVDGGVRFVVIGNYGAFSDRRTGRPASLETVAAAWKALGVTYDAAWTDKPDRFAIDFVDPALGGNGKLRSSDVRHFYQVTPVRGDVRALVRAVATGSAVPSAPVFSSATGSMALSRYLSSDDWLTSSGANRLNVRMFLNIALARSPAGAGGMLVIHDPASSDSARVLKSLSAVSSYGGMKFYQVSIRDAAGLRPMDLERFDGVVLALPDVRAPLDGFIAGLLRSAQTVGLNVVSVLPVRNPVIGDVLGLKIPESGADGFKSDSITIKEPAFPGAGGLEARLGGDGFSGMKIAVQPGCDVLAETTADGTSYPLWWRCSRGASTVGGLNAFEFSDRANLGFLMQAVLDGLDLWAFAVPAAAVEFVDDCPLPMTGLRRDNIDSTDTDFYVDGFYRSVADLSEKLDLRTTFLGVFSYDDRVSPPFEPPFSGTTGTTARSLATRIVEDDFPVGLHGANHMSPSLSGGVTLHFGSQEALESWFAAGRASFVEVFGSENVPAVFVPPNDWIDLAGRRALAAAVPEARVLASVFSGSAEEFEHDFGRDPDVPVLTGFPRTWAGASLRGESVLGMLSGVMLAAVSSHFVHPDDILDPERNFGLDWKGWFKEFESGIRSVRTRFPFLRNMSAAEAATETDQIGTSGFEIETAWPDIRVTRASGINHASVLMVRTPVGCIPSVSGGSVTKSHPASGRHFVEMTARKLVLTCGNSTRGR